MRSGIHQCTHLGLVFLFWKVSNYWFDGYSSMQIICFSLYVSTAW